MDSTGFSRFVQNKFTKPTDIQIMHEQQSQTQTGIFFPEDVYVVFQTLNYFPLWRNRQLNFQPAKMPSSGPADTRQISFPSYLLKQ